MRVLHVIPSVSEKAGGPSQAIFPMCRALRQQGIEVLLATTDEGLQTTRNENERTLNYNDVPTRFFPAQIGGSFKYSRPFSAWLADNVCKFDVVHVHAVFNHACIAAANACRKNNVPYIVRPLGTLDPWSMKQKSLRKRVFWQAGIKRMLSEAAAIHYTTEAEQNAVESTLGLSHGCVVPLGIEVDLLDQTVAEARLTEYFPELVGHPYVLVLSRLHPKKGLELLQDAFLSLKQERGFKEVRLVLAGEGEKRYEQYLNDRIHSHSAAESIVFPGWLAAERKSVALQNASLLALPSRQENFGVCVMESLASGVPVLVTPQVNLSQQIVTAGAGWIAELDESNLKDTMREALRSPTERAIRGKAGQVLARKFTWPLVASKLCELYQSVAKVPIQFAIA